MRATQNRYPLTNAQWGIIEPYCHGFVAQIGPSKDSLSESSMLAEAYEQLDTYDVQDPELGRV